MRAVARQLPELQQLRALAAAGYDVFAVDGNKPYTVLAPTNAALQALAAGITDSDEQMLLEQGFYSVVLYHQLPEGAYDISQLVAEQDPDGILTSLGRAMKQDFAITFDNSTMPVVATGGWPANNAALISSHKACDGWLHIINGVLLPTAQIRDLPRLVDGIPDISQTKFWGLLDGTGVGSGGAADAPAPAFEMSPAPPPTSHSNNTGVVVTDGNGTEVGSAAPGAAGGSSSGDSDRVLVVAASVAAGAVALCTVLVAFVLLRKRQLRRRRQQHRRLEGKEDEEEDAAFERSMSVSKHSTRPVTVHVDA
ncbi:hypothetical protein ABPG77_005673 [Micractinium sp. CCAP 211/92]